MRLDPRLVTLRELARRVAKATDTRTKAALTNARAACAQLITGIDPDRVRRDSPEYSYGGYEALTSLLSALDEQTLSDGTCRLLRKSGRARVLNALVTHQGRNQKELAAALSFKESNLSGYLAELAEDGLIEFEVPSGGRGHAYALTDWGKKAWQHVVGSPDLCQALPAGELKQALRASTTRPLPGPATSPAHQLVKKEEFYARLRRAIETDSDTPLHLSTLSARALEGATQAADFHRNVIDLLRSRHCRPLHWLVVDGDASQPFVDELLAGARATKTAVWVYRVPAPEAFIPTRQVIDGAGLLYPAAPNLAEVTDPATSLQAWEAMQRTATSVARASPN
jgi:DNA-binding MarR family transcriptional regulator